MLANIVPKNMGHDVAEIDQDPRRRRSSFNAHWAGTGCGQHPVDMIGDGACLSIGLRGTQDQIVGDRGQFRNVEDEDIRGLFVEHRPRDGKGSGLRCSYDRCPLSIDDDELYKIPLMAATDSPLEGLAEFWS